VSDLALLTDPLRRLAQGRALRFVCVGVRGHAGVNAWLDVLAAAGIDVERHEWIESQVQAHLARFHVGVMPLLPTERNAGKCGLKLLEYMATARPVVASPVGENRYIVRRADTGFLAATADEWVDALGALESDPRAAREMGERGRQLVEARFSLQEVGREVDARLAALVGSSHQVTGP
jgi:glycosyltransferase involved in cell wall biosynthesis